MKNILLAEDEKQLSMLLSEEFTKKGFNVFVAQDGVEAVNIVQEEKENIDCVLMDIMMPKKDGIEAIREIQDFYEKNTLRLPHIIALTNLDDPDTVRRVLMLNVPSYIVKADVEMSDIISRVEGEMFLRDEQSK